MHTCQNAIENHNQVRMRPNNFEPTKTTFAQRSQFKQLHRDFVKHVVESASKKRILINQRHFNHFMKFISRDTAKLKCRISPGSSVEWCLCENQNYYKGNTLLFSMHCISNFKFVSLFLFTLIYRIKSKRSPLKLHWQCHYQY